MLEKLSRLRNGVNKRFFFFFFLGIDHRPISAGCFLTTFGVREVTCDGVYVRDATNRFLYLAAKSRKHGRADQKISAKRLGVSIENKKGMDASVSRRKIFLFLLLTSKIYPYQMSTGMKPPN